MEVTSLAARLAKLSPLALADMKKMALRSTDIDRDEALECELDFFARHLKRQDLLEGLRAFAEKRNPTYRGR